MTGIKKFSAWIFLVVLILISGCQNNSNAKNSLKVGAMAGPEIRLLEVAKLVAYRTSGLSIEIVEYGDHKRLPESLMQGTVDVAFSSISSFDNESFVSRGKFFHYPTSRYSRKIKNDKNLHHMNHVVVRKDNQNDPRIDQLITALRSPDVINSAGKLFNGQAMIAWEEPSA